MSNEIFPTFPGLAWSVYKTPEWSTRIQTATSGKEIRMADRVRPVWRFSLSYEILRGGSALPEYQTMVAFFNARRGSFDSFLFEDASDNTANRQVIATGDGVNRVFLLVHQIGPWAEPIGYTFAPTVYVNGVQVSTTTDGTTVTFASPPPSGAIITWSGKYYFRVRFEKDSMEFEQFMKDFWLLKKCELKGIF